MIHIFYHSGDFDGLCSGAVIKHYHLTQNIPEDQIIFQPLQYGESFPYDKISANDQVIFADVSISPYSEMIEIYKKYDTTIIDHHQTLIAALRASDVQQFKGLQVSGKKAACELCWNFYFPEKEPPTFVKLLSTYDVWDNSDIDFWNSVVLPFQYGLKTQDLRPYKSWAFWQSLFLMNQSSMDAFVAQTVRDGFLILDYQDQINRKVLNANVFDAKFDTLDAICCNSNFKNSGFFMSKWDEKKYDLMLAFDIDKNGRYNVSLYTTKDYIDVSALASRHGGGGHKQAAGFSATTLSVKDGIINFS